MSVPPAQPPPVLGELGEPRVDVADFAQLLVGYLDWYRDTVLRKVDGLSDEQLRTPVEPLGWSPLGLIQHLGWVERRWMRWGFAAEDVAPAPAGGDEEEWRVGDEPATAVIASYREEVRRSRELINGSDLYRQSAIGGRFRDPDTAPTLGRILFHLLQEYARHAGHLDVVRELVDGVTGE